MVKRIIILILVFTLTASLLYIPAFAGPGDPLLADGANQKEKAAGNSMLDDSRLDTLVNLVKARISIPESYINFNSEMSDYGGTPVRRLRWSNEGPLSYGSGGNLEVSVNGNGTILFFNHYRFSRDYDYMRKLPKISREAAFDIARKYAWYICPDIADQVSFGTAAKSCTIEYEGNYRFSFYRHHKDIPYYDNSISIMVDGRTGEITSFSRSWTDGLVFPEADGLISLVKAQEAYRNSIPLVLKYRMTYGDSTERTYLEFSPSVTDLSCSIDALTGERVSEGIYYNPYNEIIYRYDALRREMGSAPEGTPVYGGELEKLIKSEKLLTPDNAEKFVKSIVGLGIDETYASGGCTYTKNDSQDCPYTVRLNLSKAMNVEKMGKDLPEEKLKVMIAAGEFTQTVSVVINAKNPEILSVNAYGNYGREAAKPVLGRDDMLKKAQAFLSKNKSEKYKQIELMDEDGIIIDDYRLPYGLMSSDRTNVFIYIRKAGGLPFIDNRITVVVDASTGNICYYGEDWDNIGFVPQQTVIDKSKAYDALFKYNGLQLKYVTARTAAVREKSQAASEETPVLRLVYAPDFKKPLCIDARKGILIGYFNAEPYKAAGNLRFNDIENHPAAGQIQLLAEIGLLNAEESFRPDEAILQKDWLIIINRLRGSYQTSTGTLKQKELDGMYRALINEGIIDEDERDPDSAVNREKAVKYLLNALGYKKFATLEGLFVCDFKDSVSISPGLYGYVAIARSMRLVGGYNGNFMPKQGLTRAQAAVIMYNYLTR